MKKIGIILILVWPALIAWFGLHSVFAPKWYYASAFIERNDASIDDVNRAFAEVTPKSAHMELTRVDNTDLSMISARDRDAQALADKLNAVANAIVDKLRDRTPRAPSLTAAAEPPTRPGATFPLIPNLLAGIVLGLFPAVAGIILILVSAARNVSPTPPAAQSPAV